MTQQVLTVKQDGLSSINRTDVADKRQAVPKGCPLTSILHALSWCTCPHIQKTNIIKQLLPVTTHL